MNTNNNEAINNGSCSSTTRSAVEVRVFPSKKSRRQFENKSPGNPEKASEQNLEIQEAARFDVNSKETQNEIKNNGASIESQGQEPKSSVVTSPVIQKNGQKSEWTAAVEKTFSNDENAPDVEIGLINKPPKRFFISAETLPKLLRFIGATLLVVSASSFMFRGWDGGSETGRYLTLLGQTILLSMAGFFCGLKVKENRGARTFFGLVITSIPVHFAVLGGFVYSKFSLDNLEVLTDSFTFWNASSPANALILLGVGVFTLFPLCYISIKTLARSHAKTLTGLLFLTNAVLLIPVRTSLFVALLISVSLAMILFGEFKLYKDDSLLKTMEGRFMRLMMFTPILIMIGRGLYLYQLDLLFWGIVGLSAALVLNLFSAKLERTYRVFVNLCCVVLAMTSWIMCWYSLNEQFHLPGDYTTLFVSLPISALFITMSFSSPNLSHHYRRIASMLAVGASILTLLLAPGLLVTSVDLLVSIATLSYGIFNKQKLIVVSGAMGILFCLIYHLTEIVQYVDISHWLVLTIAGAILVIAASYFERKSEKLFAYVAHVRTSFETWRY